MGQSPEHALEAAALAQGWHGWVAGLALLSSAWRARMLCKGFGIVYLFASILRLVPGKEITLLMQTLNTLSTPEEKLAALCKKYAELVSMNPFILGSGAGVGGDVDATLEVLQ